MRAMYICNCNAVTDADIRREVASGVQSFAQLQERTGCSDCCGSCEAEARDALAKAHGAVHGRAPSLAISVLARCCPE